MHCLEYCSSFRSGLSDEISIASLNPCQRASACRYVPPLLLLVCLLQAATNSQQFLTITRHNEDIYFLYYKRPLFVIITLSLQRGQVSIELRRIHTMHSRRLLTPHQNSQLEYARRFIVYKVYMTVLTAWRDKSENQEPASMIT